MPSARELPSLPGSKLDALFADAPAGEIPVGKGRGQALMGSGTIVAKPLVAITRILAWQGKVFDPPSHRLRNLITPFGVKAITADVYVDASLLDGRPCVVLDYSKTSRVAGWVRDEIREIAPGLYLGLVYAGSRRLPIRFSLEFDSATRDRVVDVDHETPPA
jgi:hypothetical protein